MKMRKYSNFEHKWKVVKDLADVLKIYTQPLRVQSYPPQWITSISTSESQANGFAPIRTGQEIGIDFGNYVPKLQHGVLKEGPYGITKPPSPPVSSSNPKSTACPFLSH